MGRRGGGGNSDWLWESLGLKGNTIVILLILGLALVLLYRNDLTDKKSILKFWNNMKPSSKLMLIGVCSYFLYLLYEEYESFETFNCQKHKKEKP